MKRVLVVDDDEAVRRLSSQVLKQAGYDVVLAVDGQQGLDLLDASFDVLLCDKSLPYVQGTQVVLEARGRFPRLTTVLMTAAPEALSLSSLGLDGYLAKPFRSTALLVHTLEAAMDRRAEADKRHSNSLPLPARERVGVRGKPIYCVSTDTVNVVDVVYG